MTDTTAKYLNRELSWLEFNQRVLAEAQDVSVPLLERLKFLAVTASNLDENKTLAHATATIPTFQVKSPK